MTSRNVVFIDGLNVFMRHFAANPSKSLNGKFCGGIYGFLGNVKYLTEKFNPEKVIVAWEGGGSVRRRAIDPNYKMGRRPVRLNRSKYDKEYPSTIDDRDTQLKVLIEILYETPVTQIYVDDCEADDVISYLVKTKKSKNTKIIVTSDKDYYQLVNSDTMIWSPNKKCIIDEKYIIDNWGILPQNFCLARCFAGDQSDGIKGVKGAGFKTMLKRFPDLFSCKNVSYNDIINKSISEVETGNNLKIFRNIKEAKGDVEKNWKLMYLDSAMLSATQIKKINYQFDNKEEQINKFNLLKIMNREGLNSFDIHTFIMALKSRLRNNT